MSKIKPTWALKKSNVYVNAALGKIAHRQSGWYWYPKGETRGCGPFALMRLAKIAATFRI